MAKGNIVRTGTHVLPVEQGDCEYLCDLHIPASFSPTQPYTTEIPKILSNTTDVHPITLKMNEGKQ
jgi:hypothetical protein